MAMRHIYGDDHIFSIPEFAASSQAAPGPATSWVHHSHHALQLSLGVHAPVTYCIGTEQHMGPSRQAWVVLIGPDVPHCTRAPAESVHFLCEPEGPIGRVLLGPLLAQQARILTFERDAVEPVLSLIHVRGSDDLQAAYPRAVDALLALGSIAPPAPPLDPRIAAILHEVLDSDGRTRPLIDLAQRTGLSGERLRHLFAQEVGLPLRKYALWRRTVLAYRSMTLRDPDVQSLTGIAHHVGFADQAALSRSARSLFGSVPSRFVQEARSAATPAPDGVHLEPARSPINPEQQV